MRDFFNVNVRPGFGYSVRAFVRHRTKCPCHRCGVNTSPAHVYTIDNSRRASETGPARHRTLRHAYDIVYRAYKRHAHTHTHSGGPGPPMHYSYIICKRVCTLLAQCWLGSSMSGGDFATQYHTHFPLSADRDRAARGLAIETHFTRFAVEHNDTHSCRSSEYAGYLNASRVIGDIASLRS